MRVLFFMPAVVMHSGAEMALFNLIHHVAGRGWGMAVAAHWNGPMLKELPPGVRVFIEGGPGAAKRVRDSFRYRFLGKRGDFAEQVPYWVYTCGSVVIRPDVVAPGGGPVYRGDFGTRFLAEIRAAARRRHLNPGPRAWVDVLGI